MISNLKHKAQHGYDDSRNNTERSEVAQSFVFYFLFKIGKHLVDEGQVVSSFQKYWKKSISRPLSDVFLNDKKQFSNSLHDYRTLKNELTDKNCADFLTLFPVSDADVGKESNKLSTILRIAHPALHTIFYFNWQNIFLKKRKSSRFNQCCMSMVMHDSSCWIKNIGQI